MVDTLDAPLNLDYIDTHCHIDLYQSPNEILKKAHQSKIGVIAVTNIPSVFSHMMAFTDNQEYAYPALGLHPELVAERGSEIELMWRLFDKTRFIGEVGLDYTTPHQTVRSHQRRVLGNILEKCSDAGDKILTIHSRRAAGDVVNAIGENFASTVILHWYTGTQKILEQAIANGYYFSINLAMVHSKKGKEIICAVPKDKILTETDGPFVKSGQRASDPSDIVTIVAALSKLWDEDETVVKKRLIGNFDQCLNH